VAEQLGYVDVGGLSMEMYARAGRHRERLPGAYLREFDAALEWARLARKGAEPASEPPPASQAERRERLWRAERTAPAPIAQLDRATPS
jgi:hypothetical protein